MRSLDVLPCLTSPKNDTPSRSSGRESGAKRTESWATTPEPVVHDTSSPATPFLSTSNLPPVGTENPVILVVDDQSEALYTTSKILEKSGYRVLGAHSGKEALELIRAEQPDLVLLDIVMPGLDGLEVCRRIKNDPELTNIFVVLLSGIQTNTDDQANGLAAGADGYITRPLGNRELVARVEAWLRIRRTETTLRETESRERHLNAVLRAIRNVNRLITKERDLDRLIWGACRNLTETLGYKNAWIALIGENGDLDRTASSGFFESFDPMLEKLRQKDRPYSVREALNQSCLIVSDDPVLECGECPDSPAQSEYVGFTTRLEYDDRIHGILSVAVPSCYAGDGAEQDLFVELAADIAFALHQIELQNQRRITEQKLARNEELFRAMFEHGPSGIAIVSRDGRLVMTNAALREILGFSSEELENKDITEYMHPEHVATEEALFREIITGKRRSGRLEKRTTTKTGEEIWVSAHLAGIGFNSSDTDLLLIQVEDITQRRRVEGEHKRLAAAIEQAAESIIVTDREGTIEYVNPAFEQITGYAREKVIGENPRVLKSGQQGDEFYRELWETITSGSVWSGRMVNRRNDGSHYTEDCTISPVRDETGIVSHFVAVKHDVTHTLFLEQQTHHTQKLEAMGRLAGGVAHDLNNMLSPILGYAELLMDDIPHGDARRESIEEVHQAGLRARDLVFQLLAFGRKQALEVKPISLNEVVSGFSSLLRRTLREDINIETILTASNETIEADLGRLEQVIMNLAVNAQDAMPRGGKLTIETTDVVIDGDDPVESRTLSSGPHVCLSISDTGCGFDAITRARIFEPFFTTKEKDKGTGLGLATVYGIVKQHGGDIRVDSVPGEGTTFEIYLPFVEQESVNISRLKTARGKPESGMGTVLVAEDDRQVRKLICSILKSLGYRVITARTPEDCILEVEQCEDTIDLLLTDVVMPEINGKELYERIRKIQPQLKVLFMSGYTHNVIAEHGVLKEGIQFIQKPFTRQTLAEKIRALLKS